MFLFKGRFHKFLGGMDDEFNYILPQPLQLHLYICYDFHCLDLEIGQPLKPKFVRMNKALEL